MAYLAALTAPILPPLTVMLRNAIASLVVLVLAAGCQPPAPSDPFAGEWIDRLVDAGGCGAIDWHVRTAFPGNRAFAEWGRAYLAILDALAARSDLFVTSCSDLLDHLNRRHP